MDKWRLDIGTVEVPAASIMIKNSELAMKHDESRARSHLREAELHDGLWDSMTDNDGEFIRRKTAGK